MMDKTDWGWILDQLQADYRLEDSVVFIGGSLARGWGNPLSDVDVYLIGDQPKQQGEPPPRRLDGGLRPIDVHLVSELELAQLFDLVSWSTALSGKDLTDTLKATDWLLLERIYHPIVLAGSARLQELQQALAESAFQYLAVSEHFTYADSFAEDALGQLEIGDVHSSVISAQASVLRAVDGLLCSYGCFSLNPKWRARAFADTQPRELTFVEYWQFQTMSELASSTMVDWAMGAIATSRRITTDVELPGVA